MPLEEKKKVVYRMGSTLPCGHVLDHSDPGGAKMIKRGSMSSGKILCPQCETARWLPCAYSVEVYENKNPSTSISPEFNEEEESARAKLRYEPSVDTYLRKPPTAKELDKHKELKATMNQEQQLTVEVLENVFRRKKAAFLLSDDSDNNGMQDVLNFLMSEYAQQGSKSFQKRKAQAIPVLKLCTGAFDATEDREFSGKQKKVTKKGGLECFEPDHKWFKAGLKVLGCYENDEWLGIPDGATEWAIAYHGSTILGNQSILKEKRFDTFGERQMYRHDTDVNPLSSQYGQMCGAGAYFSSQIKIAHSFAETTRKEETCVFEVKLKPSEVRIPDGETRYAIINDHKFARPTDICILRTLKLGSSYESPVEIFLREPPSAEELTIHAELKKELKSQQQVAVDILSRIFLKKNAAFVLCEDLDSNSMQHVLNFLLSDYAQEERDLPEQEKRLIPVLMVHTRVFDSKGDLHFSGKRGEASKKGGLEYFKPSHDWFKVGLEVSKRYENEEWLGIPNIFTEWAIGYYRISFSTNQDSTELKLEASGNRQKHQNDADINPLSSQCGKTCGTGSYFTSQIGLRDYVAFEVRLKPSEVRTPSGDRGYAIMNDNKFVRPTGICIRRSLYL